MALSEIPLPPRGLWSYEAITTLLGVASNGFIHVKEDRVILGNPEHVAGGLQKIVDTLYKMHVRPPLTRNDRRGPAARIAESLCISTDVNSPEYLRDVGKAVADLIRGERWCDRVFDSLSPISLLKLEYYEFQRSYGVGSYYSRDIKIPALTQALGLLGHAYTLFGRVRTGDRLIELHLNLLYKDVTGVGDLYEGVYRVYNSYYRSRDPQTYTSILQLLAAVSIALALDRVKGIVDGDIVEIVNIASSGNRRNIAGRMIVPVKTVIEVLRLVNIKEYSMYYKSLILAAAGHEGVLRSRRIEDLRMKLSRVMASYSESIILYSYTYNKDYIYDAVRVLYRLAHDRDVYGVKSTPVICIYPPCGDGDWIPLHSALKRLYHLTAGMLGAG